MMTEKQSPFSKDEEETIKKIISLLSSHFKDYAKVMIWLLSDNTNFGGSSPMDLICADRSEKVLLFVQESLVTILEEGSIKENEACDWCNRYPCRCIR